MRSLSASFSIFLAACPRVTVQSFLTSPTFLGPGHIPPSAFALIYGTDGTVSEDDQAESSVLDSTPSLALSPETVESLSNLLTVPLLSRLGCAFAPPPHNNLHPQKIEGANLVSLDSTKLEIAISVPSDGSLAQILVPVKFPAPCDLTGDAKAKMMEMIQQMDKLASERIEDSERRADNYEELEDQERIVQALMEEPCADDLPDWWTFTNLNLSLESECKSMKSLLNEDEFATELKSLCNSKMIPVSRIQQVAVAAVGPSGLLLRARLKKELKGNSNRVEFMDVEIPFEKEASSADALRTAVLDIIDGVEAVPTTEYDTNEEVTESTGYKNKTNSKVEERTSVDKPTKSTGQHGEVALDNKGDTMPTDIASARRQPKPPKEEARLAAKYAAIGDLGERAYAILKDLYMI